MNSAMSHRTVTVNGHSLEIPAQATGAEIQRLAREAGIQPTIKGKGGGPIELRGYWPNGAAEKVSGDKLPTYNHRSFSEPRVFDSFGWTENEPKEDLESDRLRLDDNGNAYPSYIQKALTGKGARYFSGTWSRESGTIAPEGYMTPQQISGAAYVPVVKVYTLSRHPDSWYEIPVPQWTDQGIPMEDAVLLIEAFRKYRGYRRERFTGGLPPEQLEQEREGIDLTPIRDYIAHMKAKEQAQWAPPQVMVPRHVAVIWRDEDKRFETPEEALERHGGKWPPIPESERKLPQKTEPPLPIPTPLSETIETPFKRGWNRFYRATGELPEEVARLTCKWNGDLRIRLKADHAGDFGELLGAEVNGFDLTLKRYRTGKYYQVKLDAPTMQQVTEWNG